MMPDYHVYGKVVDSKYLGKFTADTPEQAMEMSLDSDECSVSLCHQCSEQCEDAEIVSTTAELVDE